MYWITEEQMEILRGPMSEAALKRIMDEVSDQTCHQLDYYTYRLKTKDGRSMR